MAARQIGLRVQEELRPRVNHLTSVNEVPQLFDANTAAALLLRKLGQVYGPVEIVRRGESIPLSDAGINIVRRALQAPIRQIAENAGVEGSIVVGKVTDHKSPSFGYDAQTGEYGDLIGKGMFDPAKVVRVALQDASSVAGLLVTTEAMVADRPKKDSGSPAMPGGGMGGMGGMDY